MNMSIRRTRRETQLAPISRQIFDPNQINLHTIKDGMVKNHLTLMSYCAAHIGMDGMRIEKEPRQ
jgi:hypothetical protein